MAETSVERLNQIKERWIAHGILYQDDGDFIIEQAERAHELENLINTHAPEGRNYTNAQFVGLLKDFTRLELALEFYANKENYSIWADASNNCPTNNVTLDNGYRARQALK